MRLNFLRQAQLTYDLRSECLEAVLKDFHVPEDGKVIHNVATLG
jgi:hypothetical protein